MRKKYSERNCGELVTLDEARHVMLEMLNALADVCEANNLRYYLDGGTLIGAARHKGFIPWDEDIDVMMPQSDCLKLKKLTDGKIGRFTLSDPRDKEFINTECWRIYDKTYICREDMSGTYKSGTYLPLFIDIEPMVGFPEKIWKMKATFREIIVLRSIMHSAEGSLWHGIRPGSKLFHLFMRPLASLIGYDLIFDRIQNIKDRLDFDESEFVGNMGSATNTWHGRVRRTDYTRPNKLEFEGRMYSVPGNVEEYLEPIYGRNCTKDLPPEDIRHPKHQYQIYRYKE